MLCSSILSNWCAYKVCLDQIGHFIAQCPQRKLVSELTGRLQHEENTAIITPLRKYKAFECLCHRFNLVPNSIISPISDLNHHMCVHSSGTHTTLSYYQLTRFCLRCVEYWNKDPLSPYPKGPTFIYRLKIQRCQQHIYLPILPTIKLLSVYFISTSQSSLFPVDRECRW